MENAVEKKHDFIMRDGKPVAVILNIDEYEEMLECLEDLEDIKELEEMRKKQLELRDLDGFLKDKPSLEDNSFLSEQEIKSLDYIVKEVAEFSKKKPTIKAQESLRKMGFQILP